MSKYDVAMDTGDSSVGKIARRIRPGSKILEFGCAEGRMTRYMHETLGCSVSIVEIDPEAYQKAREYAEDGICCDADSLLWKTHFGQVQFDYVIFADVLEHLKQPELVLSTAASCIGDDGQVLVSIPNIGHGDIICSLLCNRFHYTEVGLLDNTHIHFWGRADFFCMAENAGLAVVEEDATYVPVGTSEQRGFSIQLPDSIRGQVATMPYAEVYQFVFSLKKRSWVELHAITLSSHIRKNGQGDYGLVARIYCDTGEGFTEQNVWSFGIQQDTYSVKRLQLPPRCKSIRLDPVEGMPCCMLLNHARSSSGPLHISATNGLQLGKQMLFQTTDPQIVFETFAEDIDWVELSFRVCPIEGHAWTELYDAIRDLVGSLRSAELRQDELTESLINQSEKSIELAEALSVAKEETKLARSESIQITTQLETTRLELENVRNQYEQKKREYDVIHNAFFWKITKPGRVATDGLKAFARSSKELVRLSGKAMHILHQRGVKGVVLQYQLRKERLKSETQVEQVDSVLMSSDNRFASGIAEPVIPLEWLHLQKKQPMISVIVAVKKLEVRGEHLNQALDSLCKQRYSNLEVVLVSDAKDEVIARKIQEDWADDLKVLLVVLEQRHEEIWAYWNKGVSVSHGELVGFLEQEDYLTDNALAYIIEAFNEAQVIEKELYLIPDDRTLGENEPVIADYKTGAGWKVGGAESLLHFGVFPKEKYQEKQDGFRAWLLGLPRQKIYVSPWVGCHGRAVESVWCGPEVRCLAFYLPQFHEIPENNEWWGDGFTEWENVKKAKPLYPGHHQPRVPGELGYYDLSGEQGAEVQKRQIGLAKQYGLSGFCYYYYWFDGGKRLLEKPVDRHLRDRSIDFPFCFCWANEPWTRKWDGLSKDVLMPQTYTPGWAEQFILDLLPYIRDERYIRVNGAPYILIYNIQEIPSAGEAINTWRRIAAEHGIERLHVSAVRRTVDAAELVLSGLTLDSLTDFPPHLLGLVGVDDDNEERYGLDHGHVKDYRKACSYHIKMQKQNYTYFRAAMLEWDNTARRGEDAYIFEHFSVDSYREWLYAAKHYSIRQNRPGEDLVFINAWNEWAEGTYLEPAEQLGRQVLEATRDALRMR